MCNDLQDLAKMLPEAIPLLEPAGATEFNEIHGFKWANAIAKGLKEYDQAATVTMKCRTVQGQQQYQIITTGDYPRWFNNESHFIEHPDSKPF